MFVKDLRQPVVDALPPPRSTVDIMARLSHPQVFNSDGTLVTLILNGTTGDLNIWCCGVSAASHPSEPIYSLNLRRFFGSQSRSQDEQIEAFVPNDPSHPPPFF